MNLPSDTNGSGRTFGKEEIELLKQVIQSGTLNCTKGTMVSQFEKGFAAQYESKSCTALTSGTAALHAAVAAINPNPGDEIITTPITDMGAIAAILYQTAIPIFADVDPDTYNVTAETIEHRISKRTRAIMVTHLFGNPCDMDPIMSLSKKHNLPVIEDCAQALLATYKGKLVGMIGDIGCFSLQQGKHITTGEGGMVITNNEKLAWHMKLFHDKAWGYGDPKPDHYFLALNYRMTELQGAVALAQLPKLDFSVSQRKKMAKLMDEKIKDLKEKGVASPEITKEGVHTYWKYCLNIDKDKLGSDVGEFAAKLKEGGIFSAPRYIQKPAFMCEVLKEKKTFGTSQFPYNLPSRDGDNNIDYDPDNFPGTMKALSQILVLPWNERYTEEHVEYIAEKVRETTEYFFKRGGN